MGEKPLYFGQAVALFTFVSIKTLAAHPEWRQNDREALALFMRYSYIPSRIVSFTN